mmetsp:Transcript_94049/g.281968  ORF Transcript_94049/g.281968 Transcript_94049/m.281968 type:complete len:326 (-) Transcript_94049:497-1474(-)
MRQPPQQPPVEFYKVSVCGHPSACRPKVASAYRSWPRGHTAFRASAARPLQQAERTHLRQHKCPTLPAPVPHTASTCAASAHHPHTHCLPARGGQPPALLLSPPQTPPKHTPLLPTAQRPQESQDVKEGRTPSVVHTLQRSEPPIGIATIQSMHRRQHDQIVPSDHPTHAPFIILRLIDHQIGPLRSSIHQSINPCSARRQKTAKATRAMATPAPAEAAILAARARSHGAPRGESPPTGGAGHRHSYQHRHRHRHRHRYRHRYRCGLRRRRPVAPDQWKIDADWRPPAGPEAADAWRAPAAQTPPPPRQAPPDRCRRAARHTWRG